MSWSHAASVIAMLPHALLCGLAVVALARRAGANRGLRLGLTIAALACTFVPIGDTVIAAWLRGLTGDLGVPTILLLLSAVATNLFDRHLISRRDRSWFAATFSLGALALYPCALGATQFDPYALGYYPLIPAPAALLLAGLAIVRGALLFATSLILAVVAYSFGLYASTNLWDYLIDPLLAGYTLTIGVRIALARSLARASHTQRI